MERTKRRDRIKLSKTGLLSVSRPVERVHYLGGRVGVQSPFDAMAVLDMHVKDAKN